MGIDGPIFDFLFQAEDGIRDDLVTGVQTCALPICYLRRSVSSCRPRNQAASLPARLCQRQRKFLRSEERRVGKECRSRWSPDQYKKKAKKAVTSRTVTTNIHTMSYSSNIIQVSTSQ